MTILDSELRGNTIGTVCTVCTHDAERLAIFAKNDLTVDGPHIVAIYESDVHYRSIVTVGTIFAVLTVLTIVYNDGITIGELDFVSALLLHYCSYPDIVCSDGGNEGTQTGNGLFVHGLYLLFESCNSSFDIIDPLLDVVEIVRGAIHSAQDYKYSCEDCP